MVLMKFMDFSVQQMLVWDLLFWIFGMHGSTGLWLFCGAVIDVYVKSNYFGQDVLHDMQVKS